MKEADVKKIVREVYAEIAKQRAHAVAVALLAVEALI